MKKCRIFLRAAAILLVFSLAGCGMGQGKEEGQEEAIGVSSKDTAEGGSRPAPAPAPASGQSDVTGDQETDGAEDADGAENADGATASGDSRLAVPSVCGALKVCGSQLCDQNGNPVQLRGISTHGLAWFPDYVNEDCFSYFRHNWNVNVMRLALYTSESGGYCAGGDQEALRRLVCDGIEAAAAQDMYVIVDWHILSDGNPALHQEEAKLFFDEISKKYADADHILYEICNEPNGGTDWGAVKAYAQDVIPVIRANDPDAVILIGTPNWCQYLDQAVADPITSYDNLMYTFHFYAGTHKEDLRSVMDDAVLAGLPVFVSEYGICDASGNGALDLEQANLWIAEMDRLGISYVAWNLSNKAESSALLKSSCAKASDFSADDFSEAGQWLCQLLTGQGSAPPSIH